MVISGVTRVILFTILLWGSTSLCYAQTEEQDPTDAAYKKCLSTDSSCANISTCAFIAYSKWDKEMERTYNRLLKTLKKEKDRIALGQSQITWKAYRDATFKSYGTIFNIPGSKWCLLRHDHQIDMVRSRALELDNYLEALRKK